MFMDAMLTVQSRASYTALTNLESSPESSVVLKDPFASRWERRERKGQERRKTAEVQQKTRI